MSRATIGLIIVAVLAIAAYFFGRSNEHNANEVGKVEAIEESIVIHDKAADAGQASERKSVSRKAKTEAVFDAIHTREISYAQTNVVAQCGLSPDGLCLWSAANANADPDAACGGNGALRGVAATGEREDKRPVEQSYCGGQGVSPMPGSAPGAGRVAGGDQ